VLIDKDLMELEIVLPIGIKVGLKIKISNSARRLNLRIDARSSKIILTCPNGTLIVRARKFAESNAAWIAKQLSILPKRIIFCDGAIVPIFGKDHVIRHCPKSLGDVWNVNGDLEGNSELCVSGMSEHIPRRINDWLKKTALKEVTKQARYYAAQLDKELGRISVRDTRSRWGSCSSRGNLSFSWRLILAPKFVLNYVCAHEVAHLVEMNHSQKFWKQVDFLIDDWGESKKWLKINGNNLHRFG
jgi:predicted metal-dependent hydrolase